MSTYESVAAESFISTGLVEFFRERIRHFLSLQSVHYELNKNIIKKCTMLPVILTVCLRSFCSPCKYSHYALDHPTRIFASVREKTLCFAKKNTMMHKRCRYAKLKKWLYFCLQILFFISVENF